MPNMDKQELKFQHISKDLVNSISIMSISQLQIIQVQDESYRMLLNQVGDSQQPISSSAQISEPVQSMNLNYSSSYLTLDPSQNQLTSNPKTSHANRR